MRALQREAAAGSGVQVGGAAGRDDTERPPADQAQPRAETAGEKRTPGEPEDNHEASDTEEFMDRVMGRASASAGLDRGRTRARVTRSTAQVGRKDPAREISPITTGPSTPPAINTTKKRNGGPGGPARSPPGTPAQDTDEVDNVRAFNRFADRVYKAMSPFKPDSVRRHRALLVSATLWEHVQDKAGPDGTGEVPHLRKQVHTELVRRGFVLALDQEGQSDTHDEATLATTTTTTTLGDGLNATGHDSHVAGRPAPTEGGSREHAGRTTTAQPPISLNQPEVAAGPNSSGEGSGRPRAPPAQHHPSRGWGGGWPGSVGPITFHLTFAVTEGRSQDPSALTNALTEWASSELGINKARVRVVHTGSSLRAFVAGTPLGTKWCETRECRLPQAHGRVSVLVPGARDPLTSWVIDTVRAPSLQTGRALKGMLGSLRVAYRLDPLGRQGQRLSDTEEASPVWLLTLMASEQESINLVTTTLASMLQEANLRIQAPNKSGRVLFQKEGNWQLALMAHIPRITLVTGPHKDPGEDLTERTIQALRGAGLPAPDDVRCTKAGARSIIHVQYLAEENLHRALEYLENSHVSNGHRYFRLAPDLHVIQQRLKSMGLCVFCGKSQTGQHGFGKCFGVKGRRGLMCWSCGENATDNRDAHFNGACRHRQHLLQATSAYLRGGAPSSNATHGCHHSSTHLHQHPPHSLRESVIRPQTYSQATAAGLEAANGGGTELNHLFNTQLQSAMALMEMANHMMNQALLNPSQESRTAASDLVGRAHRLINEIQTMARRL